MKVYSSNGFKGIQIKPDGKALLMELSTTEGDVGFTLPSVAITALLPVLVKAEAEAKAKAGLAGIRAAFDVSAVNVSIPADKNGLVISLTLPQGLEGGMGFRVDMETARRLSQILAQLVAHSGERPKTVQ